MLADSRGYVLGVLFGDGSVSHYRRNYQASLTTSELVFADSFARALKETGLNYWQGRVRCGRGRYHRVATYSKKLWELRTAGIQTLDRLPSLSRLGFVRGFYDSEGHDRGRGRGLEIYNTDRSLLDVVSDWLREIGLEPLVRPRRRHTPENRKPVYYLTLGSREKSAFFQAVRPNIKVIDMAIAEQSWHPVHGEKS